MSDLAEMKARDISFIDKYVIIQNLCMSLFYCSFKQVSPLTEHTEVCNNNDTQLFFKILSTFSHVKH